MDSQVPLLEPYRIVIGLPFPWCFTPFTPFLVMASSWPDLVFVRAGSVPASRCSSLVASKPSRSIARMKKSLGLIVNVCL